MSDLVRFAFKLMHPILYSTTLVIQAVDYASALPFAMQHIAGTQWTIAQVKNLSTGEVVQNG